MSFSRKSACQLVKKRIRAACLVLLLAIPATVGIAAVPLQAAALEPTLQLAAGWDHNLVLREDASVWAWGGNGEGQLGDDTTSGKEAPVPVGSGGDCCYRDVRAIAAGMSFSLALKKDGTVWAWGDNGSGKLGDGTMTDSSIPVQVRGAGGTGFLGDVKAIAAGNHHGLALTDYGTVWTWGWNMYGQLGDNTTINRAVPVQALGEGGVGLLQDVVAVAGGGSHSLALKANGTVWAWGYNGNGQLGNNRTTDNLVPVQVAGENGEGHLEGVVAIAGGEYHSLALKSDGTVWTWGWNHYGQLGDNSMTDSTVPVQVLGEGGVDYFQDVVAIASGEFHSVALKADGTVWTWGWNYFGQLGNNTTTDNLVPVQVVGENGNGYLQDVVAIAGGPDHVLTRTEDGNLWAWGDNAARQLGNENSGSISAIPVRAGGNFYVDLTPPRTTATPPGGSYGTALEITLQAADTVDASPTIYYTTDGSDPTTSSPSFDGRGTVVIDDYRPMALKFFAVDGAGHEEALNTAFYNVQPNFLTHGPNPARSVVHFYLSAGPEGTLYVYDAAGRLAWSTPVVANSTSFDWSLTSSSGEPLANGLYLYRIVWEDGTVSGVRELVIER